MKNKKVTKYVFIMCIRFLCVIWLWKHQQCSRNTAEYKY